MDERGAEYIARIKNERYSFLSEVSTTIHELTELFRNLRPLRVFRRDEHLACLAVAAVNAAVFAAEDDTSFIELFLRRVESINKATWDILYGPSIEYFLEKYLNHQRSPGPWRYVGAVYAHAGIAVRALPSFARLLSALKNHYGFAISRSQYDSGLDSVGVTTFGREFLRSEVGYRFTKDCLRTLGRIEAGLIRGDEIERLSGYRPGFWKELLRYLSNTRGDRSTALELRAPYVALDPERLALFLRFDAKGVAARAYIVDDEYVVMPEREITGPEKLFGYTVQSGNQRIAWEAAPWVPGKAPHCLFRGGDGAQVDGPGSVSAGEYYLVTAQEVPQEIITENVGILDYRFGEDERFHYVFRVRLNPSQRLDSLNLTVSGNAALPSLAFAESGPADVFGPNTFVAKAPDLIVSNWNETSSRLYAIFAEFDNKTTRLDGTIQDNRIRWSISPPTVGRVWIEPRGRTSDNAASLPSIAFAVLPQSVEFDYPKKAIGRDATAVVRLMQPSDASVHFREDVRVTDKRTCVVPPEVRMVEGTVVAWGLFLPFSIRINRTGLWLPDSSPTSILWFEQLHLRRQIHVESAPNQSCAVSVDIGPRIVPLWTISRVHPSGRSTISSLEIRDRILSQKISFGEFVLEIESQGLIRTGCYLLSADIILRSCKDANLSDFAELPGIERTVQTLKNCALEPPAFLEFDVELFASPLRAFLTDFAATAQAIDGSQLRNGPERLGPSPELKALLQWFSEAKRCGHDLVEARRLKAAFPKSGDLLLLPRWRNTVSCLFSNIVRDSEADTLVDEWREEISAGVQPEYQCRLAIGSGGRKLTQGAVFYDLAAKQHNQQLFTRAIGELQRVLEDASIPPLTRLLASALLQVAFFRSGRKTEAAELEIPQTIAGFRKLVTTMHAIRGLSKGEAQQFEWPDDIGLARISPFEGDQQFENSLQPGQAQATVKR